MLTKLTTLSMLSTLTWMGMTPGGPGPAEHVAANLAACEQTLKNFMVAHPDPRGSVERVALEEAAAGQRDADVRDRLVDYLDSTAVDLLVLGHSNRPGRGGAHNTHSTDVESTN